MVDVRERPVRPVPLGPRDAAGVHTAGRPVDDDRDADNHQGFATGPLASTVDGAPNAPGVQVVSTATWVGSNSTTVDHSYGAAGGYNLEVKIPLADLPAAVDPDHMGLNITPYDNDDTSAPGTTTLRHIDMSTRLGWSALGSVQSDPYR